MIKQLFRAGAQAGKAFASAVPPSDGRGAGRTNLAPPREEMWREISSNLRRIYGLSISPLVNPDVLVRRKGLWVYQEMMWDDAVKAAMAFKKLAVITTGWMIEPPGTSAEEGGAQAQEIAEFVEYCITTMEGSFSDNLLDVLSALHFGFCLHGDTVVHSPEGDRPIKEWVGRQPWVYSWVDGALRLAKAKRVWCSQRQAPCVKVTYGWWAGAGRRKTASIICTDTHPFMLLDGEFRKAGDLRAGDRLAPFNHTVKTPGGVRRAFVKTGRNSVTWQKRAWWAWEQLCGPRPANGVIHRADGDPLNDAPENLAWMPRRGRGSHAGFHTRGWFRSATPERLAARSAALSAANDAGLRAVKSAASRKANLRSWRNPAVRAKRLAGMRGKIRAGAALENIRRGARDPERRRKIAEAQRVSWTPARRAVQAERTRKLNEVLWTPERRARHAELGRESSLRSWRREENHRVLSVKPWGFADVYDMDVPGTRNFAANGVFVHNSITEKNYRPIEERCSWTGKIGMRALKTRAPFTFGFDVDPFDNLNQHGVVQWGRKYPRDKFIIFTHQREFGNFFGLSDLRAAYRAWWMKDNVFKWWSMFLDRYSIPLAVGKFGQDVTPQGRADLQTVLENLQASTSITMGENYSLEFPTLGTAQGSQIFNIAMEAMDRRIARSLLLPSQLGLSAQPDVGTYAQAKKQFDVFLMIVEKLRLDVEETLWEQWIRQLVSFNYDVAVPPKFRFKPFTEADRQAMMGQFLQAVAAGVAKPRPADEAYLREITEFPEVPEEVLAAEAEEAANAPSPQSPFGLGGQPMPPGLGQPATAPGGMPPGTAGADEHPLTGRVAGALAARGVRVYAADGRDGIARADISDLLLVLEVEHPEWDEAELADAAVRALQADAPQDASDEELQDILDEVLAEEGTATRV